MIRINKEISICSMQSIIEIMFIEMFHSAELSQLVQLVGQAMNML